MRLCYIFGSVFLWKFVTRSRSKSSGKGGQRFFFRVSCLSFQISANTGRLADWRSPIGLQHAAPLRREKFKNPSYNIVHEMTFFREHEFQYVILAVFLFFKYVIWRVINKTFATFVVMATILLKETESLPGYVYCLNYLHSPANNSYGYLCISRVLLNFGNSFKHGSRTAFYSSHL